MTHVLRASSSGHLVALIPQMLGYTPAESLVLLPLRKKRSLGVLRLDLPPADADLAAFAATAIGFVCRVKDADAFVALVYATSSEDPTRDEGLVDELARRADACGLVIVDAIGVGSRSWRTIGEAGATSHRFEDASDSALRERIEAAFGEQDLDRNQNETVLFTPADAPKLLAVSRALQNLRAAAAAVCGADERVPLRDPSAHLDEPVITESIRIPGEPRDPLSGIDPTALDAVGHLDDVPMLFESALGWPPGDLSPYEAALLLWCSTMPPLRDLALSCWAYGVGAADDILSAQLRWEAGEEFRSSHDGILMGEGPRPHVERLLHARELMSAVAERAPEKLRRAPLTIAAWLSWACGESSTASSYLDRAEDSGGDYSLGDILRALIDAGYLPPWAFEKDDSTTT